MRTTSLLILIALVTGCDWFRPPPPPPMPKPPPKPLVVDDMQPEWKFDREKPFRFMFAVGSALEPKRTIVLDESGNAIVMRGFNGWERLTFTASAKAVDLIADRIIEYDIISLARTYTMPGIVDGESTELFIVQEQNVKLIWCSNFVPQIIADFSDGIFQDIFEKPGGDLKVHPMKRMDAIRMQMDLWGDTDWLSNQWKTKLRKDALKPK